ncbi:MAG: O-antigen ligase family protein [Terracidiphilus sp.]
MGLILSILYLITYYLTPVTVFGQLAGYRIELILAVLVILVSIPSLLRTFIFRIPQSLALLGMAIAVPLSIFASVRWFGGALDAFLGFIPNAFAFFLLCLHFRSTRRLKILVAMLLFVCFFVIVHGYMAQIHGFPAEVAHQPGFEGSPYLLAMSNNAGDWFYRLRGLGEIHDPNDFAQLLVSVIPLTFFFWRSRKFVSNFFLVLIPLSALLFGVYLTHSRGALLAMMAMLIVAIRPRIGTAPSVILAGALFAVAKVFQFAGDRTISVEAGSDRISLWGQGLQVFKLHPLFGVGFGRLPNYTDVHLTAHNSIVVCAAELGFLGLYFWSLYLFPTVRDVLAIASPAKVSEAEPEPEADDGERAPLPAPLRQREKLDRSGINHLGRIVLLSFTGYLVSAWFLSRAYAVTLFLLGGIGEVVFEMALERGMVAPRMKFFRVLRNAGVLAVGLLAVMYLTLRVINIIH